MAEARRVEGRRRKAVGSAREPLVIFGQVPHVDVGGGARSSKQRAIAREDDTLHPSVKAELLDFIAARQAPCGDLAVVAARRQQRALRVDVQRVHCRLVV